MEHRLPKAFNNNGQASIMECHQLDVPTLRMRNMRHIRRVDGRGIGKDHLDFHNDERKQLQEALGLEFRALFHSPSSHTCHVFLVFYLFFGCRYAPMPKMEDALPM